MEDSEGEKIGTTVIKKMKFPDVSPAIKKKGRNNVIRAQKQVHCAAARIRVNEPVYQKLGPWSTYMVVQQRMDQ